MKCQRKCRGKTVAISRPQVFQLVRQNDAIIQCDSCNRILYYVPPPPPVEHAVVHKQG
jgi:predicted  nucleic acid-binding Zn-ribbon protein